MAPSGGRGLRERPNPADQIRGATLQAGPVINQTSWDFDNADASARAVLETARDETAVQQWLAAELNHRAKGRYHQATRESEVAQGNMPDVLISAVGALAEVAVEAKHGGKQWSTKQLEHSLRNQLAEDYLRPATRRHGVLVVTNHRKRGWTHPATRQRLTFEQMITYLNGVAAKIKRNKVGEIEVTVIGIDAVKKHRSRARKNRKKAAVHKKVVGKLVKRHANSTRRRGR